MPSGDTLVVLTPQSNQPPSSNFAIPDTRNDHLVLDFDAATDESAIFPIVIPNHYAATTGITVTVVWLASTATSGNVIWDGSWERHEDDITDLDADSFAAVQSVTATAASASGEPQYSDIVFTNAQIDGLLVNESGRFKLTRDADNASDTMAGDAEILRVIVRET